MKKVKRPLLDQLAVSIALLCLMLFSFSASAQLSGFGIESNSGFEKINSNEHNYTFALDGFYEIGNFYMSLKGMVGFIQSSETNYPELNVHGKQQFIRQQLQFKYWFGNFIRASKIYPIRCAHLIKIRNDYHFKPYLLIGVENSFGIRPLNGQKYSMNGVVGLGSNILRIGNRYRAKLLFVEIKYLTPVYYRNNINYSNKLDLELCVGLKFWSYYGR